MDHPFIKERSTAQRLKKLTVVDNNLTVKKLGGTGNTYQYTRTGIRADLGPVTYRSGWEADFARILTTYRIKFEFEPKTFRFHKITRGTKSYCPDFHLTDTDEWVELKGWFDDKSRIKLKRFKYYEPEEFSKLRLIISKHNKKALRTAELLEVPEVYYWQDFVAAYNWIPNWESLK